MLLDKAKPRDYENHEVIAVVVESLRLVRVFLVALGVDPTAEPHDRTFAEKSGVQNPVFVRRLL